MFKWYEVTQFWELVPVSGGPMEIWPPGHYSSVENSPIP